MADRIAVMHRGRLQQLASPAELYARPANLFVATFCGSPPMNILSGEIADGAFHHAAGRLPLPAVTQTGPVKLGFRPEHAALVDGASAGGTSGGVTAGGALPGEIYVVEPLGNETLVTVNLEGTLVNIRQPAEFSMPIGTRCAVRPTTSHLHLFDDKTGEALKTAFATASNRPEVIPTAHVKQGRL